MNFSGGSAGGVPPLQFNYFSGPGQGGTGSVSEAAYVIKLDIASPRGGDIEEICHFQRKKIRSHGSIFFLASPLGSDVEKISDFQSGKYVHMVALFLASPLGGDVEKIGNFQK